MVDTARRSPGWLPRPWVVDLGLLLVFGVFAVSGALESARAGSGERRLDWLAWVLVAVATAALGTRRRRPAIVLLITSAVTAVSVSLGYPLGLIWLAPLIALYTAAATGRRALAQLAAAVLAAALAVWALLARDPGTPAEVGVSVLIVALAVAIGEVARGRRDYLAETERRVVEAERTREETARRHAGEERLRLARDLHDVTAHTIAVIAIQAGVADEALDGCEACPEVARQAVRAIRVASREAMAELKATVAMLREGAAPRGPLPGLHQLDELVGMATSAGVRVQLTVAGAARPLPADGAHRPGAGGAGAGGRGAGQRRHRPTAVHEPGNRQDAREPHHEQARGARPRAARGARLRDRTGPPGLAVTAGLRAPTGAAGLHQPA